MSLGRKTQSGKKASLRETPAHIEAERAAKADKTSRLRALRLAKEAADRTAEADAAALRASLKPSARIRIQPRTPAA